MQTTNLGKLEFGAYMARIARGLFSIAGLLTLAAGCGPQYTMDVGSAYGPGMRFEQRGSTYAWVPAASHTTGNPKLDNPSLHRLIRQCVDDQLAEKGYVQEAPDQAVFWIDYRLGALQRGTPYGDSAFNEYMEGTLALYVIDPETKEWIWRAWAQAKVHEDMSPQDREARLKEAVRRMLKDVPAKVAQK